MTYHVRCLTSRDAVYQRECGGAGIGLNVSSTEEADTFVVLMGLVLAFLLEFCVNKSDVVHYLVDLGGFRKRI